VLLTRFGEPDADHGGGVCSSGEVGGAGFTAALEANAVIFGVPWDDDA
jgi:hypothetical protein